MRKILRSHLSILFFSTAFLIIISCFTPDGDTKDDFQNALLLTLSQYTGTLTCLEGGIEKSYNSYSKGFYSVLTPGTWIAGNSDTISNRYIQIILSDNIKTEGNYTYPANNISIEILDGLTTTWSSTGTGGSAIIEITKYGAVGGTIEGTFEGTLIYYDDTTPLDITSGRFAVRRNANM